MSADVSAKYIHQDKGEDYPLDVDSIFFMYDPVAVPATAPALYPQAPPYGFLPPQGERAPQFGAPPAFGAPYAYGPPPPFAPPAYGTYPPPPPPQ